MHASLPNACDTHDEMPSEPRHLMIKITCGEEAAERANQGWTVAAMGVAAGARVTVWLTGEAVWFAVPGRQPDLALPHATPVRDLVETVRTAGQIVVCTQCAARRDLGGGRPGGRRGDRRRGRLRGGRSGRRRPGPGLLSPRT